MFACRVLIHGMYGKEITMGLFDQIVGGLAGKLGGKGDQGNLIESVMGMLNNPQLGGLEGLVKSFKEKGLENVISSWIGTGDNKAISGEQLQNVISGDSIKKIADKIGSTKEEASNLLAGMLPQLIDKLTPDGKLPEGNLLDKGISLLKDKLLKE